MVEDKTEILLADWSVGLAVQHDRRAGALTRERVTRSTPETIMQKTIQ
jgi:hypothetical protein